MFKIGLLLCIILTAVVNTGDYTQKLTRYQQYIATNPTDINQARFNLAQCYFALDSITQAKIIYQTLYRKLNKPQQSILCNNLGIIYVRQNNFKQALDYFKFALRADPENTAARFNYELLKKRMEPPREDDPPPFQNFSTPPVKPRPTEQVGADTLYLPIKLSEAVRYLDELKRREKIYLQQLVKNSVQNKSYNSEPNW